MLNCIRNELKLILLKLSITYFQASFNCSRGWALFLSCVWRQIILWYCSKAWVLHSSEQYCVKQVEHFVNLLLSVVQHSGYGKSIGWPDKRLAFSWAVSRGLEKT